MIDTLVSLDDASVEMEKGNFSHKINPLEYLKNRYAIIPENVTYDDSIEKEYDIIRGSGHDGTLIFTYENINRCLSGLLDRTSFFKPTEPDWDTISEIEYMVGDIQIYHAYGKVKLPCGIYSGVAELVKLPVRCKYVLRTKASDN